MEIRYCNVPVANLWRSPEHGLEEEPLVKKSTEGYADWINSLNLDQRKKLNGRLESQFLYGEPVMILEEKEHWVKACLPRQTTEKDSKGYPGWVRHDQLTFHPRFDEAYKQSPFTWVVANQTILFNQNRTKAHTLSFMTRLPYIDHEGSDTLVLCPEGQLKRITNGDVQVATHLPISPPLQRIATAKQFLGLPYLWGGMSSFGFDCSGFVYRIFEAHGITIPRDASDQAHHGKKVTEKELQPGDLVFFAHKKGHGAIHHVGLYMGSQQFIHSPHSGQPVRINQLSDAPYHEEFCWGVRYHFRSSLH
ncbi:C40 family peptidase [Marininema halotolerans]|uniref:NlpC/P60 family protein n=1 Tax=Marininema halotolerans TaxID=1155944 RepID=A0A1I6SWJ5_9BACL|nr:C40 family peptidase [Marininema halotolerans]SFS81316.1 NlpC/P60 family protein [Marininema halotolerans]